MDEGFADPLTFELGRARVIVHGASGRLAAGISGATHPVADRDAGSGSATPILRVDCLEAIQPPDEAERQGDTGNGLVTATLPDWTWWRTTGAWSAISAGAGPVRLMLDRRAPAWASLPLVRSIARRALPGAGAVAVHASLVEVDGQGVVIAGWSESGKTEAALGLAARLGGRFISDKWVVLDGEGSWPHPGVAGLRDWVVPYLGAQLARRSPVERMRLGSGRIVGPLRRAVRWGRRAHPLTNALAEPFDRLLPLVPVIRREPERLLLGPAARGPEGPLPLAAIVVLAVRGTITTARNAEPGEIIRRIARSTAYEESLILDLSARSAYGGSAAWFADELGTSIRVLERVVGTTAAHLIETPFPADPRAVAAVIAALR